MKNIQTITVRELSICKNVIVFDSSKISSDEVFSEISKGGFSIVNIFFDGDIIKVNFDKVTTKEKTLVNLTNKKAGTQKVEVVGGKMFAKSHKKQGLIFTLSSCLKFVQVFSNIEKLGF